jgi:hypothetical protein
MLIGIEITWAESLPRPGQNVLIANSSNMKPIWNR